MDLYYTLGKLVVAVALLSQCFFLAIQVWALNRHRQRCFALLALGAALGLIYAVVAGLPYFIHLGVPAHLLIAKVTSALAVAGAAVGVWGMVLFVRSYSQLVAHSTVSSHERA